MIKVQLTEEELQLLQAAGITIEKEHEYSLYEVLMISEVIDDRAADARQQGDEARAAAYAQIAEKVQAQVDTE